MRRAARRDDNHAEVKAVYDHCGDVWDFASTGNGVADLYVVCFGIACWVEVKDGEKQPSKRKLTKAEENFRAWCEAAGVDYRIVESVDEAEQHVEEMRQRANAENPEEMALWLN